ncbi:MAG: hypothetical protein O3C40_03480 [Planctomycetota bacterium]|nr:hypothetical protein [Planctomycetota bacterium]
MAAHDQPNRSQAPTESIHQSDASSGRDDESPTGFPTSDPEKRNEIIRRLMEWQEAAAECVGDPDRRFAGSFTLVERLGRGGFSVVYRAVGPHAGDVSGTAEFALKLLFIKPDHDTANDDEPVPAGKLDIVGNWIEEIARHKRLVDKDGRAWEGFVPLLDAVAPDSKDLDAILAHVRERPIWLAMPVYHQTLADYVTEHGGTLGELSVHDARRIMRSVAHALQRMQDFKPAEDRDKEIVHRDLKPANS